ncbi:MAG: hypothetical protein H0V62_10390 [Gammaproteobacteria bacterium]|nr:hypothetical protein [Gammaproteobacteria bacterium]
MKTEPRNTEPPRQQQSRSLGQWLNQHRIAVAIAVVVLVSLAFGWNWLAAAGLLPIVVVLLACGLMAVSMRGGQQASEQTPAPGSDTGDREDASRTSSTENHTNMKERNDA